MINEHKFKGERGEQRNKTCKLALDILAYFLRALLVLTSLRIRLLGVAIDTMTWREHLGDPIAFPNITRLVFKVLLFRADIEDVWEFIKRCHFPKARHLALVVERPGVDVRRCIVNAFIIYKSFPTLEKLDITISLPMLIDGRTDGLDTLPADVQFVDIELPIETFPGLKDLRVDAGAMPLPIRNFSGDGLGHCRATFPALRSLRLVVGTTDVPFARKWFTEVAGILEAQWDWDSFELLTIEILKPDMGVRASLKTCREKMRDSGCWTTMLATYQFLYSESMSWRPAQTWNNHCTELWLDHWDGTN